MRLRYENTIDDWVAFNRYHCKNSKAVRRMQLRVTWTFAALCVLIGASAYALGDVTALVVCLVLAVVFVLVMPSAYRRNIDRNARRLYLEGANKGLDGPQLLELTDNVLVSENPLVESRMRLEIVERVVTAANYTFIYIGAVKAFVIPHDKVSEGDPTQFADAVMHRTGIEPGQ
jgi:hypothetical protein